MTICPWCRGTGSIERVSVCPCRAPEKATGAERAERYRNARHDPGCDDGWVYVKVRCDCQGGTS